jgi:hypothetical protein
MEDGERGKPFPGTTTAGDITRAHYEDFYEGRHLFPLMTPPPPRFVKRSPDVNESARIIAALSAQKVENNFSHQPSKARAVKK